MFVATEKVGKEANPPRDTCIGKHGMWQQSDTLGMRVQAPMSGEVVNVLLEEGDPVAYDQELFELNPSMASSGSRIK